MPGKIGAEVHQFEPCQHHVEVGASGRRGWGENWSAGGCGKGSKTDGGPQRNSFDDLRQLGTKE